MGGSWLTALTSDLGHGKFDGAWLVQNFENQNPANTLWTKQYNLYSKIDTEAPRYLGFEKWWGGHVNLNAEEIQFIVDELFVGNNLAAGKIHTSDGTAVDLRNIRSPIVAFCSKGDNVTPPQQALGWILDLYEDVDEIRSYGQTIVYTIHETVGHLGIFVSGGVAKKEHGEFSSNIDLIDTLPPGLYEAVFESKGGETANPDLVVGNWVMRCEARTLDDIRALGGNDAADERRFATAARISETNLALYRTFAQPMVRAFVNPWLADWMHQLHPLRLQYELFSDANPMMAPVAALAEQVRTNRRPVAADNPFVAMQETASRQIVDALDRWRDMSEALAERTFLAVYGSPTLQARRRHRSGGDAAAAEGRQEPNPSRAAAEADRRAQVAHSAGGVREAVVRSLIYAGMSRAAVDERGFETVRRIRQAHGDMPLSAFKATRARAIQHVADRREAALAAIPSMLAARSGEAAEGVRPDQAGPGSARRDVGGGQDENRRGRPAVRRGRRRERGFEPFRPTRQGTGPSVESIIMLTVASRELSAMWPRATAEIGAIASVSPFGGPPTSKYERLIAARKGGAGGNDHRCSSLRRNLPARTRSSGRGRHHRSDPGRSGQEDLGSGS